MSIPFYSNLNLNNNTIENASGLEGGAGSEVNLVKPTSPKEGDIYFNSSEGHLEIYNGNRWIKYETNTITTTTDYAGNTTTSDCYAISPGVSTFAGSKFYIKFHRAPKTTNGTVGLAVGSLGQISFVNPDGSTVLGSQIKSGMIVEIYLVSLNLVKLITPIPNNKVTYKTYSGGQIGLTDSVNSHSITSKSELTLLDCEYNYLNIQYTGNIMNYWFRIDLPEGAINSDYIYILSNIPFDEFDTGVHYFIPNVVTVHNRAGEEVKVPLSATLCRIDSCLAVKITATNMILETNYLIEGTGMFLYRLK